MPMTDHLKINKLNWDERADIHVHDENDWYGIQRFLNGQSVLNPIETAGLGDVSGLKVLHLQCHFGLDSLSIARTARAVVGVDLSSTALSHARDLAQKSGLSHKVKFIESDALAAGPLLDTDFDLAFASWGATCWLPDIFKWAEVMAGALKPGGVLYYVDGHPNAFILEEVEGQLVPTYDWHTPRDEPLAFHSLHSYNESATVAKHTLSVEWTHPLSQVFAALRQAGLTLEDFQEHEEIPWKAFDMMSRSDDLQYRLPADHPKLPLAYSFRARKNA